MRKDLSKRIALVAQWLVMGSVVMFCSCEADLSGGGGDSSEVDLTPLLDSNTNWLLSCSVDLDCGVGETCVCGSCVVPCDTDQGCRGRDEGDNTIRIACWDADPVSESTSCGEGYTRPMMPICLPQCEVETDCPDHLVCHEGSCKRPRRGEVRGCEDTRRCVDAGGSPERCSALCDEGEMPSSRMRPPPPPEEELFSCERRCIEGGGDPGDCRARCAVCEERCLLMGGEASQCEQRCSHHLATQD